MAVKKTSNTSKATAKSAAKTPAKGGKEKPEAKAKTSKSTASKKSAGRKSLARLFDETDMAEASSLLPEGEHEVRLNKIEVIEDQKKGTTYAQVEFEGIDGDIEGKKGRTRYNLLDADGEPQQGMAYLKRDLALLGYEKIGEDDFDSTLEELSDSQPMVVVNAKQNGQYLNIYIQGLSEGMGDGEGEGEGDAPEIEVGTTVSFDVDGDTVTGEVIKMLPNDEVRVKTDDGDKYEVDIADCSVDTGDPEKEGDATGEAEEIEVGSTVSFDNEGETVTGEVKSINTKKQTAEVETDDGDTYEVDLDDLSADSAGNDEPIEVGDRVKWDDNGDEKEGEVKSINSKTETAKVVDDDGDEYKLELSDLQKAD